MLSVLKFDFQTVADWEKYEHLGIEVDDVEDENLLGEFERTGSWIERALRAGKDGRQGRVLIHWWVEALCSVFESLFFLTHLLFTRHILLARH